MREAGVKICKKPSWLRRLALGLAALVLVKVPLADAAEWQWSVPFETGRVFLWVPPACHRLRALVFAQNNMIEQGILEHAKFRAEMAQFCMAEVFAAPPYETWQDAAHNPQANHIFDGVLAALAEKSGYDELTRIPVAPLGHSAWATFPWNFAAWNPERTLAILSVHGDAPQTNMTGNGQSNADWGARSIDGIPGVMVMGEYEWLEQRLAPAQAFRAAHPNAAIAMLAEPGSGHFNYSDPLVEFLALFLKKAVQYRLPDDGAGAMQPIDPRKGWLVQRWTPGQQRSVPSAPYDLYTGDKSQAFWAFDAQTARAIETFNANQIGKKPQLLGYVDHGQLLPQTEAQQQVDIPFHPLADGVTFKLSGGFLDSVPVVSKRLSRWAGLPAGAPLGHARAGGPIVLSKIGGPVEQISPDTFRVQYDLINATEDRRRFDIWLLASHPGDSVYKSAVQQALLQLPKFQDGADQTITFDPIADVAVGVKTVALHATASSGRKVRFYVLEGPAVVDDARLRITPIPVRAKKPIAVTVVAWLLGQAKTYKSAAPVARTFYLRDR